MADSKKAPLTTIQIMEKAKASALRGGLSGFVAQGGNVLALMWMRTIMNYQYRYGGSFKDVVSLLYKDGGIPRFYRGLAPALIQSPVSRFGDVAANEGALAAMEDSDLPLAVKTMCASGAAASFRLFLMPIDAWKTTKQVEGAEGLKRLMAKTTRHPTALWAGGLGAMAATWVGHFPFFGTYNFLQRDLPQFDFFMGTQVRNATIGFCAAAISDTCSNSLRVLKTTKQTSMENIGYMEAAKGIVEKEGAMGLFGRGLKTRILTNGLQGALFTVGMRGIQDYMKKRAAEKERNQASQPALGLPSLPTIDRVATAITRAHSS